jgi:hypothetical protein
MAQTVWWSAIRKPTPLPGCCGAPARWAGQEPHLRDVLENIHRQWEALDRPALVFACPTCRQMIQRHLPDIPGTFLYPLLQDAGLPGLIGTKHPGPPPNLTQQHNNRVRLQTLALETFWNETRDMVQTDSLNGITLHIPEPVLEDLDKKMILASDMEAVVSHCETTGRKILDPETGLFTGHLKIGHMTFWALYRADKSRPDPKRFELVKGYGHRMEILEE